MISLEKVAQPAHLRNKKGDLSKVGDLKKRDDRKRFRSRPRRGCAEFHATFAPLTVGARIADIAPPKAQDEVPAHQNASCRD